MSTKYLGHVAIAVAVVAYVVVRLGLIGHVLPTISGARMTDHPLNELSDISKNYLSSLWDWSSFIVEYFYRNRIWLYLILLPFAVSRMQTRNMKSIIASFWFDVSPVLRTIFIILILLAIALLFFYVGLRIYSKVSTS